MSKIIPFLLGLLGMCSLANAQIGLKNVEHLETLRNGTTYVVSHRYDSEEMAPYRTVFIENWTYSDLAFITPDLLEEYIQPGNSFIFLGGYTRQATMTTTNNPGAGGREYTSTMDVEYPHPQLELSLIVAPTLTSADQDPFIDIAFVELFVDFNTLQNLDYLASEDLSGGNRIRGWGPGVLKNKIQQLNALLEVGEEQKFYKPNVQKEQLINLQRMKLLVPDYCLIYFSPTTGDESQKIEEETLLSGYRYPVEIVTTEELNERILSGEQCYYLSYVKIVSNKYIEVVNSVTGEIIYSDAKNLRYNIKGKDLKSVSKAVRSAK